MDDGLAGNISEACHDIVARLVDFKHHCFAIHIALFVIQIDNRGIKCDSARFQIGFNDSKTGFGGNNWYISPMSSLRIAMVEYSI